MSINASHVVLASGTHEVLLRDTGRFVLMVLPMTHTPSKY